jgi:hypothetical protein
MATAAHVDGVGLHLQSLVALLYMEQLDLLRRLWCINHQCYHLPHTDIITNKF